MARTFAQIYNEIIAEKVNQSTLQDLAPNSESFDQLNSELSSGSRVGMWRLFALLITIAIWTHELLFDQHKLEIDEIIAKSPNGTPRWYQQQVFDWQFGDSLQYIDLKYQYTTIDQAKQIAKLCAVQDRADGVLIIKVAKLDNANEPIPLTTPEINALVGYIFKIRFAGTRYTVVSSDPDLMKVTGTVYYDPIFDPAVVQANVEIAIDNYLKNLPFDGTFKINSLIDSVQTVEGVKDFTADTIEAKYGALSYAVVQRTYISNAGYLRVDGVFPLSSTITYTPSTV